MRGGELLALRFQVGQFRGFVEQLILLVLPALFNCRIDLWISGIDHVFLLVIDKQSHQQNDGSWSSLICLSIVARAVSREA